MPIFNLYFSIFALSLSRTLQLYRQMLCSWLKVMMFRSCVLSSSLLCLLLATGFKVRTHVFYKPCCMAVVDLNGLNIILFILLFNYSSCYGCGCYCSFLIFCMSPFSCIQRLFLYQGVSFFAFWSFNLRLGLILKFVVIPCIARR